MKKLRIISTITTILIMTAIFTFSSQDREQSASISTGLTEQIAMVLSELMKMTSAEKAELVKSIHGIIRKLAHFIIYSALGASSSAMLLSYMQERKRYIILVCSTLFCCFYAATDEIHQIFVSGRGPQFSDVLLDTSGAVIGGIVFLIIYYLYEKLKGESHD